MRHNPLQQDIFNNTSSSHNNEFSIQNRSQEANRFNLQQPTTSSNIGRPDIRSQQYSIAQRPDFPKLEQNRNWVLTGKMSGNVSPSSNLQTGPVFNRFSREAGEKSAEQRSFQANQFNTGSQNNSMSNNIFGLERPAITKQYSQSFITSPKNPNYGANDEYQMNVADQQRNTADPQNRSRIRDNNTDNDHFSQMLQNRYSVQNFKSVEKMQPFEAQLTRPFMGSQKDLLTFKRNADVSETSFRNAEVSYSRENNQLNHVKSTSNMLVNRTTSNNNSPKGGRSAYSYPITNLEEEANYSVANKQMVELTIKLANELIDHQVSRDAIEAARQSQSNLGNGQAARSDSNKVIQYFSEKMAGINQSIQQTRQSMNEFERKQQEEKAKKDRLKVRRRYLKAKQSEAIEA